MAAEQPDIRRTDLQQHDLSVPGREVVQARVDLGTLEYQIEGQPPTGAAAARLPPTPATTSPRKPQTAFASAILELAELRPPSEGVRR